MSLAKRIIRVLSPSNLRSWLIYMWSLRVRIQKLERNQRRLALQLAQQYQTTGLNEINRHEFGIYSQNGEDGILLYLFSRIGTTNQRFVEFGVENGQECNTANLSLNFGWHGLLMDGGARAVEEARYFYANHLRANQDSVQIIQAWVTAENINQLISDNLGTGEIDLLSIDIDGNDYWVWQAITAVNPRVVVIEYNPLFGAERAITIPYQPAFSRYDAHRSGAYFGASLAALTRLAQRKGYILAGCDTTGVNAFFVRQDAAAGKLENLSPAAAYYPSQRHIAAGAQEKLFASIEHLEFETIE